MLGKVLYLDFSKCMNERHASKVCVHVCILYICSMYTFVHVSMYVRKNLLQMCNLEVCISIDVYMNVNEYKYISTYSKMSLQYILMYEYI